MKPGRLVVAASLVGAASYLVSVANAAPRFDNACLMSGVASTGPRFDNAALRTLRVSADFHGPARQIIGSHFVRTRPHSLSAPQVVASSPAALELVGLANLDEEMLARVLSGNELLPGSEPAAHCYCGHQFGAFAGQLGDGAAMYLGEVFSPTLGRWELQLKGAGPTPFSRSSDGRKVLRSSVREFLASEAVHCLGVPTTRAASLVTSASTVVRDVRYDGNARPEACAVVARVARTFVRFGSFEICRPTDPQTGRTGPNARTAGGAGESPARSEPLVLELVDYVAESFLGLVDSAPGSQERALALLESVCASTAELLARWQGLGFTHGVLNTDNMGILSDTIDYGPYGFMGHFDKLFTPNSSDNSGRYCYDRQPAAVEWNVAKLGQTLALAGALDAAAATACTDSFRAAYERAHLAIFRRKLGLTDVASDAADAQLVAGLLETLDVSSADMSLSFLALGGLPRAVHKSATTEGTAGGENGAAAEGAAAAEVKRALSRLAQVGTSRARAAKISAPSLPVQAIRQLAAIRASEPAKLGMYGLDEETVDFNLSRLSRLEEIARLSDAGKLERDAQAWRAWIDRYVARLALEGREVGEAEGEALLRREAAMARSNPAFVLREHLLQAAIAQAECGDFGGVRSLLARAQAPYFPGPPSSDAQWAALLESLPSDDALDFVLT